MDTPDTLSDDAREIKEVSALFGRVVFFIQTFERQLGITLASIFLSDPEAITKEQYDVLLSRNFKKTLGQLFHKLKDDPIISLAGSGSAGALWQWAVPQSAPDERAVECHAR